MSSFLLEYFYCAIYVICLTLVLMHYTEEKVDYKRVILLIFIYSIINYVITGAYANTLLKYIIINCLIVICDFIYSCLVFESKKWYFLFLTTLYFCSYSLCLNVVIQLINIVNGYQPLFLLNPSLERGIAVLLINMLSMLCCYLLKYFKITPKLEILKYNTVVFNIYNYLILCIFIIGYWINIDEINRNVMVISFIALLIWITTLRLLNNYASTKIKNEELMMKEISNNYIEKYLEYYKQESKKIRKLKHDLKNHKLILQNIKDQNSYMKYTDEVFNELETPHIQTNNLFIDACLYAKQVEYPEVDFKYNISINHLSFNDKDITTLLFNLIDNACHEAMKSDKCVKIDILYDDGILQICVRNTLANTLNLISQRGKGHGYGLKIIRNITDKYHGDLFIDNYDNTVTFNVILTV